jgi:DNA-binding IclR family transcriptional regulator
MPLVSTPPTDLIRSVDRALTIVEAVGQAIHGLTVHDIAARCDLGAPSARHHIATLAHRGYLLRWDDRRYTVGPALADRTHDLATQLGAHYTAGATVAALASHLDRPRTLVYRLLTHGAAAKAGTCSCATAITRP